MRTVVVDVLLGLTVLCVWLGSAGMVRVRRPMQGLHYVGLPGAMGTMLLTAAMFVQQGFTVLSWKTLLIAVVMLSINSVVAHATARAFRVREVGHWEHRHGDDVEIIDDRTARSAP